MSSTDKVRFKRWSVLVINHVKMNISEVNAICVLKTVFGYENFKNDIQKRAILAICNDSKNMCISLSPGYGKSLCFQLPALLHKGKIAIVFSPKLSFIKQEIEYLKYKQINAHFLSKGMHINERDIILNDLKSNSPTIVLLYITPEIGAMEFCKKLLISLKERSMLSYVVFNEAHCLSEWGYDYVPCYRKLKILDMLDIYKPKIAVTTTVTHKVIDDISKILKLKDSVIFTEPASQLNVYYDVWFIDLLPHPINHLKNFLIEALGLLGASTKRLQNGATIIYCREVGTAEFLKDQLNTLGISTLACHHRLHKNTRCNIENKWISGEFCVMITTFDYGFIYAQSIRCIVYWTVPETIAKYYRNCAQMHMTGGRAYCRIYFSTKEYTSVRLMIENHRVLNDVKHIKIRLNEYDKMVSHCLLVKCRHAIISEYFGSIIPVCKMNCDVCENEEIVEIRTRKFITYSQGVEGVNYNIGDVDEGVQKKKLRRNTKQDVRDDTKAQCKNSKPPRREVSATNGIKKFNEQSDNQLPENEQKFSLIRDESLSVQSTQLNPGKVIKFSKDNSETIWASVVASTSLSDKYNLNKGPVSLEPDRVEEHVAPPLKRTTHTQYFNSEHKWESERRIKVLSNCSEIKDETHDRVSRRGLDEAAIIKTEHLQPKSRKRFYTIDMNCMDFKMKREKLDPEIYQQLRPE